MHHLHAGLPILPLVIRFLPWADLRRFARALRCDDESSTEEGRLLRQHMQGRRVTRFVENTYRSAPWRDHGEGQHPLDENSTYDQRRAMRWIRSDVGRRYDLRILSRFMAQNDIYRRRDPRATARHLVRQFPGATVAMRERRATLAEIVEASNSRWDLLPLVRTLDHHEIVDHGI